MPEHSEAFRIHALNVAKFAHLGQKSKYSKTPFILHPMRVANAVALIPLVTDEMIAAAYCHDVLEDTTTTVNNLMLELDRTVTDMVILLTNIDKRATTMTREERKARDLERLKAAPINVRIIKVLDRLDNINETIHDIELGMLPLSRANKKSLYRYCNETYTLCHELGHDLTEKPPESAVKKFNYFDYVLRYNLKEVVQSTELLEVHVN